MFFYIAGWVPYGHYGYQQQSGGYDGGWDGGYDQYGGYPMQGGGGRGSGGMIRTL